MLVGLLLSLSACKTDDEKASAHLKQAQEFVLADDAARARVEFLNVLRITPNDIASRFALAGIEEQLGNRREAYAQMLRIVEQDPRHIPSRLKLAAMAMDDPNWTEARKHLEAISEVASDNPELRVGLAIVDYADAAAQSDTLALQAAHARLLNLLPDFPKLIPLHYAIIDGFERTGRPEDALKAAEAALALDPGNLQLSQSRLSMLYQLNRTGEIEAQLKAIVRDHPTAESFRQMLVEWYIKAGNLDAAEAVLRNMPDPTDTGAQLTLVRFLTDYRGSEEALITLEQLVAAHGRPTALRLLRAAMAFDDADTESAIREMREAVATAEERGEDTAGALFMLAQMLDASGERQAAENTLSTLLVSYPRNVPAAQLQSVWLLERGRPDLAMRLLKTAQAVSPEDPKTLLLLSRAYDASGDAALATQMLARAFDESENNALTALDYAARLATQGNLSSASDVLTSAIEKAPDNITLMARQGALFVAQAQWDRAETIEGRLRVIGSVPARMFADRLQFQRLVAQGKTDLAKSHIELRAQDGEITATGLAMLARAGLEAGLPDLVQYLLDLGTTYFPQSAELRAVAAELAIAMSDLDKAAEIYTGLTVAAPQTEALWTDFIALRKRQGSSEVLLNTIEAALQAVPESPQLKWELATTRQANGQVDAAIASYEALFAEHPQNAPVRNNLAALLLERGQDEASVTRAAELVEPLVGSPIPQFLDTIGLVRFYQGEAEAAVAALIPAAQALGNDPQVQWHTAEALASAGRLEDARRYYQAVLDASDETTSGLAKAAAEALASHDASKAVD